MQRPRPNHRTRPRAGAARPWPRAGALAACLVLAACAGPGGTPVPASPPGSPSPSPTPTVPSPVPSAVPSATPAPSPGAVEQVLLAAGDIGRCDATADDDVGALVATLPGAVATLGDTAYGRGTADELRDCFGAAWGGVRDRIRYAVTGNHDVMTDAGAPLRDYLGPAAARDDRTYFSDELGTWHVVVLDANCDVVEGGCGPDSPQVGWLRDDLAASGAACTLALWHQPRFSSGWHGNDATVAAFWDALHAAGADLVLNGHDHDYERFLPQDPAGTRDDARGITEFVAGTGGGAPREFEVIRPNSAARAWGLFGVLELTLHDGGWAFRFVPTAPGFADEGTGRCH